MHQSAAAHAQDVIDICRACHAQQHHTGASVGKAVGWVAAIAGPARRSAHAQLGLMLRPPPVLACVGLQDIIRVRRAEGSLRAPVADHMTSPALTVGPKVSVRQAAKIMLQHKIRRLPVVDKNGRALG